MIRVTLCSVDVKSKFDFTLDTAPSFSAEMRLLSLLSQSVSQSVSQSSQLPNGERSERAKGSAPATADFILLKVYPPSPAPPSPSSLAPKGN